LRVGNLAIWNMTGQPSITVPCGTDANAMPLGLLITGRIGADETVLAVAERFEAAMASYTHAND
jgi:Asp-tRNA(Asn)/Glu-tRNA(Gln) amidotransferase A subunit family amidase